MPVMGGKELMQELRDIDPDLKALGITGYTVRENTEKLKALGFLGVIHKPFKIGILAQAIRHTLSASVGRWS